MQRALAIWEKALGPNHPDTATSLDNLAVLYADMGDYAKAEPLSQRALAIREKALGPNHPSTANSLNNRARLYEDLGDYAKAEPSPAWAATPVRAPVLQPMFRPRCRKWNGLC
jgi:tetratricopeptide (TPR) repeat protein